VPSIIDSLKWGKSYSLNGKDYAPIMYEDVRIGSAMLWEDGTYSILRHGNGWGSNDWIGRVDLLTAECFLRQWFPELVILEDECGIDNR
jgi:hypothetical protein